MKRFFVLRRQVWNQWNVTIDAFLYAFDVFSSALRANQFLALDIEHSTANRTGIFAFASFSVIQRQGHSTFAAFDPVR